MSSARKRSSLNKANNEIDYLKQKLVLTEYHAQSMEKFAKVAAIKNGELQVKIDELMFEFCQGEMTDEQFKNYEAHQKAVQV